jgi:folate-binding Fe-S cluster repair protein YgfZ
MILDFRLQIWDWRQAKLANRLNRMIVWSDHYVSDVKIVSQSFN